MDEGKGEAPSGGQGELTVLGDPHRLESDMNLIRRAVRERWPVAANRRPAVVDRLLKIVERETVDVPAGDGVFSSTYHADSNAIKAAVVLRTMEADNQRDEHHADDLAKPAGGTTVNVGVQVNTLSDERRIQIAAEAGVLHLLPAELQEKAKEKA